MANKTDNKFVNKWNLNRLLDKLVASFQPQSWYQKVKAHCLPKQYLDHIQKLMAVLGLKKEWWGKKFLKWKPDWMDCYEVDCSTIQDNPVKVPKVY